jgi:putative addiction module antidote
MPKVFRNGNSLVVSVPQVYAHQLSIQDGSEVDWEKTEQGLMLKIQKKDTSTKDVDARFAKMVEEFMDEHKDVLEELSNR